MTRHLRADQMIDFHKHVDGAIDRLGGIGPASQVDDRDRRAALDAYYEMKRALKAIGEPIQ